MNDVVVALQRRLRVKDQAKLPALEDLLQRYLLSLLYAVVEVLLYVNLIEVEGAVVAQDQLVDEVVAVAQLLILLEALGVYELVFL